MTKLKAKKDQKNTANSEKQTFFYKNKKIILIIVGLGIVIGGYFLSNYFITQRQINKRREAMEKQMQVMQDFWAEQGLSEEEIQEKMKESRPSRSSEEIPDEARERMPKEGFNPGQVRGMMK